MKIGYKKSGAENAISLLQGVAQGAENYAQGKRYRERREDDRKDADRGYGLRLKEDARQDQQNARAQADSDREAEAFGPRQDALKERTRTERIANDQQEEYARRQQQDQAFEDQVETDTHRQRQAQEYRRVTGKDMPDEYFQNDAQGKQPGELGWHWSQYDIRSDVPIKTQIGFNKRMSELSSLPPNATRAQQAAAARNDAHKEIVESAKQDILDEAGSHVISDEQGAEPDPSLYVPADKFKKLQDLAKDETAKPDALRKAWESIQKSHAQELAQGEARQIAVEGLDMHAQRIAQRQADYGDLEGKTDPQQFEDFRTARHRIADSKLSGAALQHAVDDAKALLTPGPKPRQQNDKTGYNAGDALKAAMGEASSIGSGLNRKIMANPDQEDMLIQMRARQLMQMTQSIAGGDVPRASGSGNHQNTPEDQARAAQAVEAEMGPAQSKPKVNGVMKALPKQNKQGKPDPAEAPALKAKAQAAGWTREEFIEFGQSGKQPSGKQPIR